MSVIKKRNVESLASSLNVVVSHFAKGTYIVADEGYLPVNRFFTVLQNSTGDKNCIIDRGRKYGLMEGAIYCIPCYHTIRIELDDAIQFISIQMNMELLSGVDLFSQCKRVFVCQNPALFQQVKDIYEMNSEIVSSVLLKASIYNIAGFCLEKMAQEDLEVVTRFGAYKPVIDYISMHCHAGVKVEQLASIMNCGREAFTRRFTRETGISPKQFFNQFLIKKACDCLKEHNVTVREVAFELKFSNEYYFSRFFKKHTGISPSSYQRNYRIF